MSFRLLAALVLFASSSAFAAPSCKSVFVSKIKIDPVMSWRETNTRHAVSLDGSRLVTIETNDKRERVLKSHDRQIHDAVYVIGDGPWTYFAEAPDVSVRQTQYAVYQTGKYPKYDVSTGGKPVMRATFSLGPSGHVGSTLKEKIANAEHYAKTDRIFIWVEVDGKRTDIIRELKSHDLSTFLDLEIPLVKGKEVKLFYARYGEHDSLYIDRINGFMEGRVFGFTWDGN